MPNARKARVFMSGRSQHVTIPAEYRFTTKEVFVEHNPQTGAVTLTEKPPRRSLEEIFKDLDEAGAAEFFANFAEERDTSLPPDRDFFER